MLSKILSLSFTLLACQAACGQIQPSQNPTSLQPNSTTNSSRPQETVIQYFNDPVTGKPMEVVKIDVPVSVSRWETQELTEKRIETQWVVENQKTTQYVQVPSDQVHLEPQWVGWLNPRLVYVPRRNYQSTAVPVDQPVRYPKYVEVERKVQVPKLVQATEYRTQLYQRERTPANNLPRDASTSFIPTDSALSAQIRPNPMQIAANEALAQNGRNSAPLFPVNKAGTSTSAFTNPPISNNYATVQPILQLPGRPISNALSGVQRSFRQSIASWHQPSYTPLQSPSLRPSTINSTPVLPQTAALPGTFRDPVQTGLGATVLR